MVCRCISLVLTHSSTTSTFEPIFKARTPCQRCLQYNTALLKASDNQTVDEIEQLKALVTEQQAKLSALSHENTWLKEQLELARLARFGTSSEKHPAQDDFFNEAETCDEGPDDEAETATLEPHQRKKPGRKPLPKNLPRERVIHDLADDNKICTCCGGDLHVIGEEVSEQLDIVPAQVRVLERVKLKYAC